MSRNSEELQEAADFQTIEEMHPWMIDRLKAESEVLGRLLTWQEAMDSLKGFLSLETNGEYVLQDWLECTEVPVVHWEIESALPVAWGNFETQEDAENAIAAYMQKTGKQFSYTVVEKTR